MEARSVVRLDVHNVDVIWLIGRREEVPSGKLSVGLSREPQLVRAKQNHDGAESDGEDVLEIHCRRYAAACRSINTGS